MSSSFIWLIQAKTSAVCARKPLLLGAQTASNMVSDRKARFIHGRWGCWPVMNKRAQLLRNVNLFLFVNVAEKVNQATNKGDCCQPECNPSG